MPFPQAKLSKDNRVKWGQRAAEIGVAEALKETGGVVTDTGAPITYGDLVNWKTLANPRKTMRKKKATKLGGAVHRFKEIKSRGQASRFLPTGQNFVIEQETLQNLVKSAYSDLGTQTYPTHEHRIALHLGLMTEEEIAIASRAKSKYTHLGLRHQQLIDGLLWEMKKNQSLGITYLGEDQQNRKLEDFRLTSSKGTYSLFLTSQRKTKQSNALVREAQEAKDREAGHSAIRIIFDGHPAYRRKRGEIRQLVGEAWCLWLTGDPTLWSRLNQAMRDVCRVKVGDGIALHTML